GLELALALRGNHRMRAAGAGFQGTALFSRRTSARGCGEQRAAVGRALAGPGPPALRCASFRPPGSPQRDWVGRVLRTPRASRRLALRTRSYLLNFLPLLSPPALALGSARACVEGLG
ncbi:unnamed protein product, partial [Pelagomonas calceolata]